MPDTNVDIVNIKIKEVVKEKYGQAALRVTSGGSSCCGAAAASGLSCDPITSNLYDASQAGQIPEEALLASLGCGNPTALAQLNPGETVLDPVSYTHLLLEIRELELAALHCDDGGGGHGRFVVGRWSLVVRCASFA